MKKLIFIILLLPVTLLAQFRNDFRSEVVTDTTSGIKINGYLKYYSGNLYVGNGVGLNRVILNGGAYTGTNGILDSLTVDTPTFTVHKTLNRIGIGTTVPSERLHIDSNGGTDGTGRWHTNASVSTADATVTTIYTLATGTNLAYRIIANVIAAQDDGSNSMGATWCFTIKNVAGTVTEQGDAAIQETDDSAGVTVSGAVSGINYLIQVTGINPENWNWETAIDVTCVAH